MASQNSSVKQIKKTKKFNQIYLLILIVAIVGGLVGGVVGAGIMNKRFSGVDTVTGKKNITVEESSATIEAAEKISPSVVSIVSTEEVQDIFGSTSEQTGGGTGFIITSDGLIATNKHVVENTRAQYQVFTSDGKNYKAKVKAVDPLNDFAIVQISAKNLPVAELGNSDDLKIGQRVIVSPITTAEPEIAIARPVNPRLFKTNIARIIHKKTTPIVIKISPISLRLESARTLLAIYLAVFIAKKPIIKIKAAWGMRGKISFAGSVIELKSIYFPFAPPNFSFNIFSAFCGSTWPLDLAII